MSTRNAFVIDTLSIREEVLTPKQYMSLTAEEKARIKDAKPVPPKLGEHGFGGILVRYKSPVYRAFPA
ncbi:MAG: hypothetical protein Q4B94_04435 [Pseudomonadota bacterium]|nr:hypothetical protein [Pseudomonadota bacterium]